MRPVLDFLNRLDAEKDKSEEEAVIAEAVDQANLAGLDSVSESQVFEGPKAPEPASDPGPRMRNIQYKKPEDEVAEVMKALNAKTLGQVGQKTFEYFHEMEY